MKLDQDLIGDLLVLDPTASELEAALTWCGQVVAPSSAFWSTVKLVVKELNND